MSATRTTWGRDPVPYELGWWWKCQHCGATCSARLKRSTLIARSFHLSSSPHPTRWEESWAETLSLIEDGMERGLTWAQIADDVGAKVASLARRLDQHGYHKWARACESVGKGAESAGPL